MDYEAFSVDAFCAAHSISRAHFYNLQKRGQGPAVFKAGKTTLVSKEAAAAWRRRLEQQTAAQQVTEAA